MSEAIDKFLETLYSDRAIAKAKGIPNKIGFEDENGELLKDWGEVELTWPMKLALAEQSIKWHQSIETTMLRIVMVHANAVLRAHDREQSK